jgi:hypothetical protein
VGEHVDYLVNCLAHQDCAGRIPRDGDGYLESRFVGGRPYIVRLNGLCATTDCLILGANVDWNDSRSQAYLKAMGAETLTLASDAAAVVVLKTPLSGAGKAAQAVGLTADGAKAALQGDASGLAPNVIEAVVKPWLNRVWGLAQDMAQRAATAIGKILDKNPPSRP